MFPRLLIILISFVAFTAHAATIGNESMGWRIEFDKVTAEQKKAFGWFDDELKIDGFKKFSNTYSVPGLPIWTVAGKVAALHSASGPAFFSITELLNDTSLEDVKKLHYRAMSDAKGFREVACQKMEQGADSCEVQIYNWSPAKSFYAVFYEWKTLGRTFVLVVRNAQPSPDRKTPESAARTLISLMQRGE